MTAVSKTNPAAIVLGAIAVAVVWVIVIALVIGAIGCLIGWLVAVVTAGAVTLAIWQSGAIVGLLMIVASFFRR